MSRFTRIAAIVTALVLPAAPALAEGTLPGLPPAEAQEKPDGAKPDPEAPAAAAQAAPAPTQGWLIYLGAAASSGVIIIGAAYGISRIGSSAVESMARQPEVAGNINTAMIVSAALIEGVTFFALIVCLLNLFYK